MEEVNQVYLRGVVCSNLELSHEIYSEKFYDFSLKVERLSGQFDILPVIISERLFAEFDLRQEKVVTIIGQFRSYNKLEDGRSRLVLKIFAKKIVENDLSKNPNVIALHGFLCKQPIYRTTPLSREIADVLIAVNRSYNKSDYIPLIIWGRNARFVKSYMVGDRMSVVGRIQSREYVKKIEDVEIRRMAYEISVSKLGEFVDTIDEIVEIESKSYEASTLFHNMKEHTNYVYLNSDIS